jgi:VanZ family protein
MNAANSISSSSRHLGLAALVAIAVLSVVPGSLRPHILAVGQLEHFLAYLVAALLLSLGFWNRRNLLFLWLWLPTYAAVLEIAQIFIAGRNSDFMDFLASSAGAWAGIGAARLLHLAWRRASAGSKSATIGEP